MKNREYFVNERPFIRYCPSTNMPGGSYTVACTRRLRPISGFFYTRVLKYMKWQGNMSLRYLKGPFSTNISNRHNYFIELYIKMTRFSFLAIY